MSLAWMSQPLRWATNTSAAASAETNVSPAPRAAKAMAATLPNAYLTKAPRWAGGVG